MYETNSPGDANNSLASLAYREKLRQEQMQPWTRLSLGGEAAAGDNIVQMQMRHLPPIAFAPQPLDPTTFSQRANKRVSQMDNEGDDTPEAAMESSDIPMDLDNRPKRGLPRQSAGGQPLSKTQSLPLFSMEEDF